MLPWLGMAKPSINGHLPLLPRGDLHLTLPLFRLNPAQSAREARPHVFRHEAAVSRFKDRTDRRTMLSTNPSRDQKVHHDSSKHDVDEMLKLPKRNPDETARLSGIRL